MRRTYMKRAISVKKFIAELGTSLPEEVKNRISDLEVRCVFTRKDDYNTRFDIKHLEHIQQPFVSEVDGVTSVAQKELTYGQIFIDGDKLYFAERSTEGPSIKQSEVVTLIYNALTSEVKTIDEETNAKLIDSSNIDFIIDSILSECPEVSESYLSIMSKYM